MVTDDYVNYRDHTEPSITDQLTITESSANITEIDLPKVYDDARSNKEKQICETVTPNYWAKYKRNKRNIVDLLGR